MPIDRIRSQASEVKPLPRRATPDVAFSLRPKLLALREKLLLALRQRHRLLRADAATLFYFHPARQAEFEATRDSQAISSVPNSILASEITARIQEMWPSLVADADVRHAARALDGLHTAATALAVLLPAARDLSDLLYAIDDEVFCVIEPASREGFTLEVRGVAEVNQLHDLLPSLQPRPYHDKENGAFECPRWQAFSLSGLQRDGTLPRGPQGVPHWLFNEQPATVIPRFEGERVILLGDPLPTTRRTAEQRFPDLMAEGQIVHLLSENEVEQRLSRWLGQPLAITQPSLARAA